MIARFLEEDPSETEMTVTKYVPPMDLMFLRASSKKTNLYK